MGEEIDVKYEYIEKILREVTNIQEQITRETNLLELGLSSIQILQLVGRLRKSGYKCTFTQLISNPFLDKWAEILVKAENKSIEKVNESVKDIEINMYEPFDLTDVQYAYWVGRKDGQYLGNVGCHGYLEVDGNNVSPERLNTAWKKLQEHHPMLRVKFTEGGKQQIIKKPFCEDITVYDYRKKDSEKHLKEIRENLSHRLLNIEEGQVAALQLTLLPNGKTRLHLDIDLLVADVKSYQIILRDLAKLYGRNEEPEAIKEWNFAAYLERERKIGKEKKIKAKAYWEERIEGLPGRPELPVRGITDNINHPKFTRREAFLEKEKWAKLKELASKNNFTPAMVLLCAYGEVIKKWSENNKFLMNIPLFNRYSDSEDIENVVADFTTLLLLEMDMNKSLSFVAQVNMIQKRFHKDMEYLDYSGLKVQRDYLRIHPGEKIVAPIVYSCNLGIPLMNEEFKNLFGEMSYMISQTPQVWLDYQVFDMDNGLLMIWDGIDEIFPEGLLDSMFKAYQDILEFLVENEENWSKKIYISIDNQMKIRKSHEVVDNNIEMKNIHQRFFENSIENPDNIALVDVNGDRISYGELRDRALRIATLLKSKNLKENESIAISLPVGRHQIEAVLGILAVGGKYVSVGINHPLARRKAICKKADIRYIIKESCNNKEYPDDVELINIEEYLKFEPLDNFICDRIKDSAYVIFTSGSTGEPKGVEITHESAYNTIYDINKKYNVSDKDSILAISAIDFDLSVYDIFGLLSAGGTVVLIPENKRRDSKEVLKLMKEYSISIWNSVPILLDMLMLEAESSESKLDDLRIVLSSGDWINIDLPERVKSIASNSKFISLGGATEGSIWSNFFEVELPIPSEYKSIPYGEPLVNQKYRIVNLDNEDCPDLVSGELLIGGTGVAKGYIGDEELTDKQFVDYKGELWYKTGDYGRFWPNGIIEFLGRRDHQVKIRGHRIELEEIERNYKKHSKINKAVVLPIGKNERCEYLVSFIVPKEIEISNESNHNTKVYIEMAQKTVEKFYKLNDISNEKRTDNNYEDLIENLTVFNIVTILKNAGWETEKNKEYNLKDKLMNLGINDSYFRLITQWFELLDSKLIVKKSAENTYSNLKSFDEVKDPKDEVLNDVKAFVETFVKKGEKLLRNEINPLELVYGEGKESIDSFSEKMSGVAYRNKMTKELIVNFIKEKSKIGKTVKVLELGARKLNLTADIIDKLDDVDYEYTLSDKSSYFKQLVQDKFNGNEHIKYENLNLDECDCIINKYDLIVAFDSLHRVKNVNVSLKYIRNMLAQDGILIFGEKVENSAVQLITIAFLEQGFDYFEDVRNENNLPLLKDKVWESVLLDSGYKNVSYYPKEIKLSGQKVFYGFSESIKYELETEELKSFISQHVPNYMVPSNVIVLDKLPITKNGKIDRKKLVEIAKSNKAESVMGTLPETKLEIKLSKIWGKFLKENQIYMEDDFYLLGGDSLVATQLTIEINNELNIDISLEIIFKYSLFNEFVKEVEHIINQENIGVSNIEDLPKVEINKEDKYKPFPLTDIQQAYWIGRSGVYDLSDVSTHCYFEMDCEMLDVCKLEKAWNTLIKKHEMMRAVIQKDGQTQVVLENVSEYNIKNYTVDNDNKEGLKKHFDTIRNQMAGQMFDSSKWPLFEIRVTEFGENKTKLHMSFDNIIFDGFSIFKLFSEWNKIYNGESINLNQDTLTFRDYVLTLEKIKSSDQYYNDLEYWKNRVVDIPAAPELPVEDKNEVQQFTRFEFILKEDEWKSIFDKAGKYHLTPSVVFMGAYSEVLARYSKNNHFTINLTRFNPLPIHEDVKNLVGDFTSLTLLEVDNGNGKTFSERCKNIEGQLIEDLKHSLVSGVVVERELMKNTNRNEVTMPIVFTSGLGVNSDQNYLGEISYGESQTPQVWIDHQISQQNDKLFLSWDAVCGLFPDGFVAEMFDSYKSIINELMNNDEWEKECASLVKINNIEEFEEENWIKKEIEETDLVTLFKESVNKYPEKAAVVTGNVQITYKELDEKSTVIAEELLRLNIKSNSLVGIIMEKDYEQIVAVLGILKAGGAYLPIDVENPHERIENILKKGQVTTILTKSEINEKNIDYFNKYNVINVDEVRNDSLKYSLPHIKSSDLAYVIFTSGSTGEPKGVMINHLGVINTIKDINDRYSIDSNDRTICLSNLNFDLSVYDIFGMLSAGGAIVIPDQSKIKNPQHWIELIEKYKVTVWNSVPAFMQMLIEYNSNSSKKIDNSIKVVLLSGDWIPVSLPEKIKDTFRKAQVVGLGGATEASIWSNYYNIPIPVPKEYKSIPYGKPLINQKYYILNKSMERCPVWVPGDLYIAGKGLALGYCNDSEKTESSFLIYEKTGEIIYKTGDMARYKNDGNIEFLGRNDNQIKLNGHRIELGEIELQIRTIDGIKDSVVTFTNDNNPYLTAHLIIEEGIFIKNITSIESMDIDNLKKDIKLIGEEFLSIDSYEETIDFIKAVEILSLQIICEDLKELGVSKFGYNIISIEDIINSCGVERKYEYQVKEYMNRISAQDMICVKDEKYILKNRIEEIINKFNEQIEEIGLCRYKDVFFKLKNILRDNQKTRLEILRGKLNPKELLIDEKTDFLIPSKMFEFDVANEFINSCRVKAILKWIINNSKDKLNVLEIGSRTENNTQYYSRIIDSNGKYTYSDESTFYLDKKKTELCDKQIEFLSLDLNKSISEQGIEAYKYDLIIADNTLHRNSDLNKVAENIKKLLVPGGWVVFTENTVNSSLMLETVAFFEDGYSHLKDDRKDKHLPLLSSKEWRDLFYENGYSNYIEVLGGDKVNNIGKEIILVQAPEKSSILDEEKLKRYIEEKVPEYMMPTFYFEYDKFPLSANGKIDRKILTSLGSKMKSSTNKEIIEPSTEGEKNIADIWGEVLNYKDISMDDNFFSKGGDSLKAIQFINHVKERCDYNITLEQLFEQSTLKDIVLSAINNKKKELLSDADNEVEFIEGSL